MAILNITEFFHPVSPDNIMKADDLIHLGRTGNAVGNKDIYLTGTEFFNGLNLLYALYGAAGLPTAVGVTPALVQQYAGNILAGANPTSGLITVQLAGTYRVSASIFYTPDGNTQSNVATLSIQGSVLGSLKIDVQANASGNVQSHLQGSTIVSLGLNETVGMYLESSDPRNVVINDTLFEIKPLFI